MRTINAGDVFILNDIIHGKFSMQQLKALHYAFGTLSGRPVVVIRPPAAWDKFGMVTVIPAMSKGTPSYKVSIENIFGKVAENNPKYATIYKWMPHYPYTVPVTRLGKHVGSLTIKELKTLMDAFEWIHNPFKQIDMPPPEIYQEVIDMAPVSQKVQNVKLNDEYRMQTLDEFNGVVPKVNPNSLNPIFKGVVEYYTPEILDETVEESTITPEESGEELDEGTDNVVSINDVETLLAEYGITKDESEPDFVKKEPIVKKEEEDLNKFTKRFSMNDKINDFVMSTCGNTEILYEMYKKDRFKFNESVVFGLFNKPNRERFDVEGLSVAEDLKDVSHFKIDEMWASFDALKAVDIWLIIPNLDTRGIARVYRKTMQIALLLKKICAAARSLNNNDYSNRRSSHLLRMDSTSQADTEIKESSIIMSSPYITYESTDDIDKAIIKLKPYLNANKIENIPENLYTEFLSVPMYLIRKEYQGKHFLDSYKTVLAKIRAS